MTPLQGPQLREQLQAALGSAITLEEELSGGGMSRVFAAREVALARRIVVKVLSPELFEGVSAERFTREIRIAASLQQANIVPVIATGQTNGLPFYTMPFVEGLSLRERLRRDGPLPIKEAAHVLRDVARALAFAHQHGVVHRDIKPENVLLSGDAAVVTDFGIAKAITEARTQSMTAEREATLTQAGIAIGTPSYMAPEQISGDPSTDHRADIYAYGCLAYELLTGAPPFHSRPAHELFAAHLSIPPVPIEKLRPDCPPELAQLVMQCLEKKPERRPQSARELLEGLDTLGTIASGGYRSRPTAHPWRMRGIVIGAVVLLAAIIAYSVSDSGRTRTASVAVLPLTNVGGDSAQEYLADGIADELATTLGRMPGIRVASRTLAARYRGQRDADVRDVGRALDVAYVLQGTVRRAGDKLRVSVHLASASDGVEIWSESYDRGADQVFALQDAITQSVADALQTGGDARRVRDVRGTRDPEAYDLYMRGQYLLRRRGPGVRQAAEHFERAIARDSLYARAHAGLAAALELFPYFAETPAADVSERAMAAARRALALDSTLSEAHTALGLAFMHAWDWTGARREMQRAVELDPDDPSAHHQYGRVLLYVAGTDSALAEFRRAKAIDPFSSLYSAWIAMTLQLQGDSAGSLRELGRALELDSLNLVALQVGTLIYWANKQPGRAVDAARKLSPKPPWVGISAATYARAGDRNGALRLLRALEQPEPRPWFSETAIAFAALGLGDTLRALAALERATDKREIWPSFWPIIDSQFDGVRSTDRFKKLLDRVGLSQIPSAPANR